jgi:C4-dicarboxylate-specific signal transduction histidine kinase
VLQKRLQQVALEVTVTVPDEKTQPESEAGAQGLPNAGRERNGARPIAARPIAARPIAARPIVAQPTVAQRIAARPTVTRPIDLQSEHPALVAYCDDLRLEQALINLIGNALDAVSGVAHPRIEIDIDASEASEASLAVTVRDNGPGIAPDALPRLFEPFFTTKEMGQGLGLGLAIASSIARDCGGSLAARNEPGGGAAFVLTLRRAGIGAAQHSDTLPQ